MVTMTTRPCLIDKDYVCCKKKKNNIAILKHNKQNATSTANSGRTTTLTRRHACTMRTSLQHREPHQKRFQETRMLQPTPPTPTTLPDNSSSATATSNSTTVHGSSFTNVSSSGTRCDDSKFIQELRELLCQPRGLHPWQLRAVNPRPTTPLTGMGELMAVLHT
eukprot:3438648-Amphidinium_carterae.1